MADFISADWNQSMYLTALQQAPFLMYSDVYLDNTPNSTPPGETTSGNTFDYICDTQLNGIQTPQSKKRQPTLESSELGALVRSRKTRKLKAPHETAKTRKKGACFLCQKKRKEVNSVYSLSSPLFHLN